MDASRYERIKIIGKGSFGQAFLVKSTASQKLYVLKEIKLKLADKTDKTQQKAELDEEAKIIRKCCHINIIRFKEYFFNNDGSKPCLLNIVMEHADAGDLHQQIVKQRDTHKTYFHESQVRNWFVQLTFALQYLHKNRILHRDIKSQNVFMTSIKLLKLGDFGISKTLNAGKDFAETMIGTPTQLSPEMVAGQKYDYKSDLWALGCTVYEMCALRPAFVFNASFQVMGERISSANYSPIPSAYSKELAELIKVMLKPDPKRRPTAYQLLSSTALEKDLNIYMDFVKSLPSNGSGSSSQISDSSSDSAGATRKSSCSSMGSGDLAASSSDGSQVSKNQPPG